MASLVSALLDYRALIFRRQHVHTHRFWNQIWTLRSGMPILIASSLRTLPVGLRLAAKKACSCSTCSGVHLYRTLRCGPTDEEEAEAEVALELGEAAVDGPTRGNSSA